MTALAAQHLRKSFGPQVVLDDASFAVDPGEKVALIGANGAGKSTLARILAGSEVADGGAISVRRGLSVRYLAQEPVLDADRSAREVVEDGLTAWRAASERHAAVTAMLETGEQAGTEALLQEQADLAEAVHRLGGWDRGHEVLDVLHKLGVREVERACGPRSGGERRRIALAQLLVARPDVAILDEPTNHLDADTAEWLEGHLARDFRGAIILVTHDRYFLDAIAQRIVELERGRLTSYPGGYGDYLEKKAELLAHEERVEQNRQNVLRREREWLSRGPKARATKQKARIQRALALEARGPATAGRPGEVGLVAAASGQQGKTILELHGAVLATPERRLTLAIDLRLTAGERVGIVGPNGVGKTTLIRAILAAVHESTTGARPEGAPRLAAGSIVVGKNTRVAYLDQGRAELDDDKSIFDDVRGEGGGTVVELGVRGHESMDLRSYLELFLFDGSKQRQKVGSLSGGERARVALAKVLREGANLLVFDEPTNDLDLPTLGSLEGLLEGFKGSVLVVTHDRAFLDGVATSILAFEPSAVGGPATVTRYAGGYQDYLSQRGPREPGLRGKRADVASQATTPAASGVPSARAGLPVASKTKTKDALSHAERLELEGIVDAIDAAEQEVCALDRALADPALYAKRPADVASLRGKQDGARKKAASLVARWELLEQKRGR